MTDYIANFISNSTLLSDNNARNQQVIDMEMNEPLMAKNDQSSLNGWMDCGEIKHTTVHGYSVRYFEAGEGEPLVLSHTIRSQLEYFQRLIPALAQHYHVFALDLPSHGHTEIVDRPHNKSLFVDFVAAFIEQQCMENVTLMGESIGASLSLGIAAERKRTIKQVIALNPADYEGSNGLDRSSLLGKILFTFIRAPLLGSIIANGEQRPILKKIFQGGFNDKERLPEAFVTLMSEQGGRSGYPKAFRSIFTEWKSWRQGFDSYSKVNVPVTLIFSENDWALTEERERLHHSLADSKMITIPNCGHFSALEKPSDILDILL